MKGRINLQALTAGSLALSIFLGVEVVLVCRISFGKPPPQLNFGRV